jgi:hypothetical protein
MSAALMRMMTVTWHSYRLWLLTDGWRLLIAIVVIVALPMRWLTRKIGAKR